MALLQSLVLVDTTALAAASTTTTAVSLPPKSYHFLGRIKARNVNGATTVTGKIQHSPDNVVWYDAISFTPIVGANGDELVAPTLSNLFLNIRAVVTLAGTTKLSDVLLELYFDPRASA